MHLKGSQSDPSHLKKKGEECTSGNICVTTTGMSTKYGVNKIIDAKQGTIVKNVYISKEKSFSALVNCIN